MAEKQELVQTEDGPMTPEQIRASGRFYSPQMTWEEFCEKSRRRLERVDMYTAFDLKPYWGKAVAWELDGSAIRAAGDDRAEVRKMILDAGLDPQCYVFDYIPGPDELE